MQQIRRLFIELSDCVAPLSKEKALSFGKFIDISIDFGLFEERRVTAFLAAAEEQSFGELRRCFRAKVETLKLRLIRAKRYSARFRTILDNLERRAAQPQLEDREERILWISYRLVDEESKRLLVELELESLLPAEIRDLATVYRENQFEDEQIVG